MKHPTKTATIKNGKVKLPKDFMVLKELWIGGKKKKGQYAEILRNAYNSLNDLHNEPSRSFAVYEDSILFGGELEGQKISFEYITEKQYKKINKSGK